MTNDGLGGGSGGLARMMVRGEKKRVWVRYRVGGKLRRRKRVSHSLTWRQHDTHMGIRSINERHISNIF